MGQLKLSFLVTLCLVGSVHAQDGSVPAPAINAAPSRPAPVEGEALGIDPQLKTRGDLRLAPTKFSPVYRKKWALIVGVNYANRGEERELSSKNAAALPSLNNAVKDAQEVSTVLREYYAFEEQNVIELLEADATFSAIDSALGSLCNVEEVDEEDCVFVFFSGHGVRSVRGTSFLAHDVHLAAGSPVSGHLRLEEIVRRLEDCPAKHKLLVLDHCYSGDVFNNNFQAQSVQDRADRGLLREPAFQAMASCRATQVALDAGKNNQGHSPFTAALIDGLTRLPANGKRSDAIGTTKLASYIATTFDVATQKPECRNLDTTDGEFSFWPAAGVSFEKFRVNAGDRNMLNAMTSRHGDWWFNERPWFIPGVRTLILNQLADAQDLPRAAITDRHIDEVALRIAAQKAFDGKGSDHDSTQRHYELLMTTQGTNKFQDALRTIRDELLQMTTVEDSAPNNSVHVRPEELHLLAIMQHALKESDSAHESYRRAEAAYDEQKKTGNTRFRISSALCCADHGELLLEEMGKAYEAAEKFREAESGIRTLTEERDAGAVFRMTVLCREASAYLRINRWKGANQLLLSALELTEPFASDSYFAAQVHRNRAWAQIIQWKMQEAKGSFEKSNQILASLFENEREDDGESASDADLVPPPALESDGIPLAQRPFRGLKSFKAFHDSQDFASKLAYLHNLHGIAMAQRFRGHTLDASQNYRSLARHVEATYSDLTQTAATDTIRRMYVIRSINTQERLGDCNLFGDPDYIDLKEAIDDYRRSRNLVYQIAGVQRRQLEAVLLYKTALAQAMPSDIQDTQMAIEMCARADAMFELDEKEKIATGLYWALGKLTTPMVAVLDQKACSTDGEVPCEKPASALKDAILAARDKLGQHPHRDQLEILLFASRVLLEHSATQNRFAIAEDSDLLLSFCRLALASYHFDGDTVRSESTAYLRPYYDAVMRAKISIPGRKHVLDLLEIQAEATTGARYMKPEESHPILATYVLDDECYLLLDLPRGTSKAFPLASIYDNATIQAACYGKEQLTLPGEILGQLNRWLVQNKQRAQDGKASDSLQIDLRWIDPVRNLSPSLDLGDSNADDRYAAKYPQEDEAMLARGQCPFSLPRGFTDAATETVQSADASAAKPSGTVSASAKPAVDQNE
ncbi:Caspase domain protein [Novipirellula galeiformis]|uniref:Caspase domain protein n=1 Tax=Novipirellula galeiformis TaxID=2528004 RepID=A0A5C6CKZ5_9BACT|nr:caspase family protein [Novipirellula galeiformis]TWU25270.1 Caspase domain protein [Novipirellula galeiformis]